MFILRFIENPIGILFFLLAIVIAVTVHEFAHAKSADELGDPTADLQGRVTLDPRAHLDVMGSILFLIIGFGWGKPVPFDPFNLRNPRKDAALISFAGPGSNFVMALGSAMIIRLFMLFEPIEMPLIGQYFLEFLVIFIWVNITLGIFNLLPFAPLDGFKIVGGMLSEKQAREWYSLERYGIFFLIFFLFPFTGGKSMLQLFVIPVVQFLNGILLP